MKKFPSILFVFSLLFMLTACSSSADPSQESSGQTTSPSSQQDSVSVSNAVLESESTESEQSANNTLIVYFSRWGNTEYPSDVDAITSASIVVDNNSRYGTTEYVANMIAENVGGDLHRIETVTPYTADFDELRDVNHDEMSRNYLPELKESNLDISAYDTVFIGYPVWATKVIDEKSPVDPNFERHNSVIEIYNQAAAELMAELNVRVNDLYKISEAFNEEYYSDWVHPNYLGSRLLAEQVVRFLKL